MKCLTTGLSAVMLGAGLVMGGGVVSALQPEDWVAILQKSYPERISQTRGSGDTAALKLDQQWYLWADRRLVPESLKTPWDQFDSHSFFPYNPQPEDRGSWSPERLVQVETRLKQRETRNIKRLPAFFDALWDFTSREFSRTQIVSTPLLHFQVRIHRRLVPLLAQVNQDLQALGAQDPEIARWFRGLRRIDGHVERNIAGTQSRSSHSYGIALDLIPKTYGDKVGYWRWAYKPAGGWYAQAWNNRWEVPPAVVEVFHRHGFIWGGNWVLFDPIHFEYRPELIQAFQLQELLGGVEPSSRPTAPGSAPGTTNIP